MKYVDFFATTDVGIEDIVAKEISQILGISDESIEVATGRVYFKAPLDSTIELNFRSRTINKLYLLLARAEVSNLDEIYRVVKSIDFTEYISKEQSFAIRAERFGEHDFTSLDIARVAGKAVIDSYLEVHNHRLKVNLDNPDIEIYCMLRDRSFIVGINTSGPSLHKRNYRVYNHPAALKTTIASSMIIMSNWDCRSGFLDPMCGGGTIVIEAALMARNVAPGIYRREFAFTKLPVFSHLDLEGIRSKYIELMNTEVYDIEGIDISPLHLEGAIINAISAGVDDTIVFRVGDARKLEKYLDIDPKVVVVNPPYGIRMHHHHLWELYRDFMKALRDFPGLNVVVITAASKEMRKAAILAGIELVHSRRILHGTLESEIIVFRT